MAGMTGRIVSVDIMRGLTMAAMIVVNNPGSWAHMAPGLRHAAWGAWPTPADFVFPFFLVLVGVATPLAMTRRVREGAPRWSLMRRALQRAAVLAAIGLFLNLFPAFDLATVRIPGVLQRIAVVSAVCAAAYLWLTPPRILLLMVGLLAGYTALLLWAPVPGPGAPLVSPELSLPTWLDDRVFGAHTWRGPGDPEGILSSLGAAANGLMGVLAGLALGRASTVRRLQIGGGAAVLAGSATLLLLPLAKELWTAPYALITGGVAVLTLALLERAGWQPGPARRALELFGRQALTAYILAHLLSDLFIQVLRWDGGNLHLVIYRGLLASWLPEVAASLAYSLFMLTVVWLVVWLLDRRGFRLRV